MGSEMCIRDSYTVKYCTTVRDGGASWRKRTGQNSLFKVILLFVCFCSALIYVACITYWYVQAWLSSGTCLG